MKRLLCGILLLLGVAGCNPAKNFSVVRAAMPTLNGLNSLHGRAVVANSGTRDLVVESMELAVGYRGRKLGTARLLLAVEVPAGRTSTIRYDFALDDVSLSSLQTLRSRLAVNPDAFTVDVKGYVKWGRIREKIDMKEVPLAGFMGIINNFAP